MTPTGSATEHVQPIVDGPAPVVCTLAADERPGRALEWADIRALSSTTERLARGAAASFPISMADAVQDLAEREHGCCGSWLSVSMQRLDDQVRLEITTDNPDGLAMILTMAGLA